MIIILFVDLAILLSKNGFQRKAKAKSYKAVEVFT